MISLPKLINNRIAKGDPKIRVDEYIAKVLKVIPWASEYSLGIVEFFESEYNSIHRNVGEYKVKNNNGRYKYIQVLMLYNFLP